MSQGAAKGTNRFLAVGGGGERDHSEHARTYFLGNCLDRAALAGRVAAFEEDNDPKLVCLHPRLEMTELDLKLLQLLLIDLAFHP